VYKTLKTGLATAASGGLAVAATTLLRTTLIVSAGVGMTNAAQVAAWGLTGLGGVLALVGTVPVLRNATHALSDRRRGGTLSEKSSPEVIRRELAHQKEHHPQLATELERCIAQIANMETQRAKFAEVLEVSSKKESWNDVSTLLRDVEDTVLANLKKVILFGISYEGEPLDAQLGYRSIIQTQLAKNEQLLDKAAEMRRHVAFLIGGDEKQGSPELDAYLSVLRGMVAQDSPAMEPMAR